MLGTKRGEISMASMVRTDTRTGRQSRRYLACGLAVLVWTMGGVPARAEAQAPERTERHRVYRPTS